MPTPGGSDPNRPKRRAGMQAIDLGRTVSTGSSGSVAHTTTNVGEPPQEPEWRERLVCAAEAATKAFENASDGFHRVGKALERIADSHRRIAEAASRSADAAQNIATAFRVKPVPPSQPDGVHMEEEEE